MTTRITVTTGDGDLLERNAQQQAANRQGALVKGGAEQAADEGAEQQRQRRSAEGLDPTTGRPLPSAGSTSRLTRIDQEPAAFREGGAFYVGVAWVEVVEDIETNTGIVRVRSGDASAYAETTTLPYPSFDGVVPSVSFAQYETAMQALTKPSWIGTIGTTPGIPITQWRSVVESIPGGSNAIWHATPREVDFGSWGNFIGVFNVLPAGNDAAYVIYTDEKASAWAWSKGLYHGYRYLDAAENRVLFSDAYEPINQGVTSSYQRKVSVFYVTKSTSTLVETPEWADSTYSLRLNGTYKSTGVSDTYTDFRNPDSYYYAQFAAYPMPTGGEEAIQYPPIGRWINTTPPSWTYSTVNYTLRTPLPLDPGFPVAPETDDDSFPGGSLSPLEPSFGGIFTPFEFFKATNDFRGDASTPASRSAYGMPQYQYQADKTNYAPPESATVINAFALDPDEPRTIQETYDDSIAAQFLAFNPSTQPSRGSRALFAPVGTAQIDGDYASPVYFSDWENPGLCTSFLSSYGFSQTPAANP